MTVAALATSGELDLRHETELVKAALLYADRVTLVSPVGTMLASLASLTALSGRDRAQAVAEMLEAPGEGAEASRLYSELRRKRRRSPQELQALLQFEQQLARTGEEMAGQVEQMLEDAGAGELAQAVELGVVDFHDLGIGEASQDEFFDVMLRTLSGVLEEAVAASAQTFPLFDDGAGELLRSMIAEGRIADARPDRATEVGVAGQLIGGLEAFPGASMDELLDVRAQLSEPLVRFRAALAQASREFKAQAWDESFPREVSDYYRREVQPALLDVEDALEELGARATLLRVGSHPGAVAGVAGTLALAAAAAAGAADLPTLVYGAPGTTLAGAGATELRERRSARAHAERNSFYFLYGVEQRLT